MVRVSLCSRPRSTAVELWCWRKKIKKEEEGKKLCGGGCVGGGGSGSCGGDNYFDNFEPQFFHYAHTEFLKTGFKLILLSQ